MLFLSGCHLFATAPSIDCVKGQPCADPDTGPTTTDPADGPSLGWIVALDGGSKSKVRRYSPSGEMAREWSGFGGASQVAWDTTGERGVFAEPGGVYDLAEDGTSDVLVDDPGVGFYDLAFFEDMLLLTLGEDEESALYAWDMTPAEPETLASGQGEFGSIAVLGEKARTVFVDDRPDLYSISTSFVANVSQGSFDVDGSLVGGLAIGPDDGVFLCSPAGAIYAIADLVEGNRTPVLVYDGEVSGVFSCAYDRATGDWLLGTTSGVIRLDPTGRAAYAYEAPGGYTISDISFF